MLQQYINMYRFVKKQCDRVYVIAFEDVVARRETILGSIQDTTGLFFYNLENFQSVVDAVKTQMSDFGKIRGRSVATRLPTRERDQNKPLIKEKVQAHPLYDLAYDLYLELKETAPYKEIGLEIKKNSRKDAD